MSIFSLSLLWWENFGELLFQFYRWISYFFSRYLRNRRLSGLQWTLLCIFSWFRIWLLRCFTSKRFCYLLSVFDFIIIFIFRWNLLEWISRFVSTSHDFNFFRGNGIVWIQRTSILNKRIDIKDFITHCSSFYYEIELTCGIFTVSKTVNWKRWCNGEKLLEQELAIACFVNFYVF